MAVAGTAGLAGMQFGKDLHANVKQFMGSVPKRYEEGVNIVAHYFERVPADKRITIVGHSKGGGEAFYASAAASLFASSTEKVAGLKTVVFNPAVINDANWVSLIHKAATEKTMNEIASRSGYQEEVSPYVGAKPHFLVTDLDNQEFMAGLIWAICDELLLPKPKRLTRPKKKHHSTE